MKKRWTRPILASMLAVIMCLNISVTALAADEVDPVTNTPEVLEETAPPVVDGNIDEESGFTGNTGNQEGIEGTQNNTGAENSGDSGDPGNNGLPENGGDADAGTVPESNEDTENESVPEANGNPENNDELGDVETPDINEETLAEAEPVTEEIAVPDILYRTHVQTYGWQDFVSNGTLSGTEGQYKRLEGIEIKIENAAYEGSVEYRTHVQTYGWQGFVSNGAMSGTEGQYKRMEAIQIRLTGELAEHYDIYYRVHCQTFGWMGWAKNGENAGSAGYAKRLEGIQILLKEKGEAAPEGTGTIAPYQLSLVEYETHAQTYGWLGKSRDGELSGTEGQSKRLEGIRIRLSSREYAGDIEYRAHVQTYGWQNFARNGELCGTEGQSKRLEAIQIRLTGEMAARYDVYYRVHCQTFGWLGWASNGQSAGSEGFGKRMEAIQIQLIPKGGQSPADGTKPYVRTFNNAELSFSGYVQGIGEVTGLPNGSVIGTTGQSKRLEGICINLDQSSPEVLNGSIEYRVYMQEHGWSDWVSQGNFAGTKGEDKRLEAVEIRLTGGLAQYYNVYYSAHVQGYGWLGWAGNGQTAGTTGISYRMEGLQVQLQPKYLKSPYNGTAYYKDLPIIPHQSGGGIQTFNLPEGLSDAAYNKLNEAIRRFSLNGYKVGFSLVDLKTGKGVNYRADDIYYSASTIKGPYVASLCENFPYSVVESSHVMRPTIKESSNSDYDALRRRYGGNTFSAWLSDLDCPEVNPGVWYTDITARSLVQMWTKMYSYFTSGKEHSDFCSELFTHTARSPITNCMSPYYTVYSKAGWLNGGGYYQIQNDGGIVMKPGHPYAIVILSNAYKRMDLMDNLVWALESTHDEIVY